MSPQDLEVGKSPTLDYAAVAEEVHQWLRQHVVLTPMAASNIIRALDALGYIKTREIGHHTD